LLFPPLGIPLLWLTRWPLAGKVGGSIVSGVLLLSVLTSEANEPTAVTVEPPAIETTEAPTPAEPAPSPAYQEAIAAATAATAELATAKSSADWNSIAGRWQSAIASLGDIPISSDDYSQAQVKLAEYERNYGYAISQKDAVEAAAAAAIAQQQAEEQAAVQQQQAAAAQETQVALPVESEDSYMSGTCKELKASGVGSDFTPGDANYTSARDRDNDGVACES
ncbi:MAG: excalibur calcium-binding domain-containing protein, partial [Phormidesmis sp.]